MLRFLESMQFVLFVFFTAAYAYQIVYLIIGWVGKGKGGNENAKLHRYAAVVAARNESAVIANLIRTLKEQDYPSELLDIYVIADNCTDNTAKIARNAGAYVYERFNKVQVGKGYALEYLFHHIFEDKGEMTYDGFFVFDADNVLDCRFVEEMNRTFSDGYEVVTSYRNSKNYGDNWISAGYALWFIRESRYLNNSRMLLGTSCAVSGTGFLFSRQVMESTNGWKFHLLTEDIEFSVHHILQGRKIGFCADAVLYDEQPVTFRQSWRQRLRWARGFLQVFRKYGFGLVKGIGKGHFSCYDMSMTVMPAYILTVGLIIAYLVGGVMSTAEGISFLPCLMYILQTFLGLYVVLFLVGVFTTITEWKRIHTTPLRKVLYTVTFPLFMLTYIPISMVALFSRKVQWKPIEHHRADRRVLETAAGRK